LFTRSLATRCAKLIANDLEPRYLARTRAKLNPLLALEACKLAPKSGRRIVIGEELFEPEYVTRDRPMPGLEQLAWKAWGGWAVPGRT